MHIDGHKSSQFCNGAILALDIDTPPCHLLNDFVRSIASLLHLRLFAPFCLLKDEDVNLLLEGSNQERAIDHRMRSSLANYPLLLYNTPFQLLVESLQVHSFARDGLVDYRYFRNAVGNLHVVI